MITDLDFFVFEMRSNRHQTIKLTSVFPHSNRNEKKVLGFVMVLKVLKVWMSGLVKVSYGLENFNKTLN